MDVVMNDYKELISNLLFLAQYCHRNYNELFVDDELKKAADAIEQLCTDVARLEAENRAKEQYIAETIGKVIKERDAAIADFETFAKTAFDKPFACDFCKHEDGEHCKWKKQNKFDKDGCFGRHFEWRGVQEVEP